MRDENIYDLSSSIPPRIQVFWFSQFQVAWKYAWTTFI